MATQCPEEINTLACPEAPAVIPPPPPSSGEGRVLNVLTAFGFRPELLKAISPHMLDDHYSSRHIAESILRSRFKDGLVSDSEGRRTSMEWFELMGFTSIKSRRLNNILELCDGAFSAWEIAMGHFDAYFEKK